MSIGPNRHDAPATTGITATTGASGTGASGAAGTGATGSGAAAVTESAPDYRIASFHGATPPASAGDPVLATKSADFDTSTFSDFGQPDYPRALQVVFSGAWDGGTIEVTGLTVAGADQTDTFTPGAGTTVGGARGFVSIRRIRNTGTRTAGTVDVQFGPKLAVPVGTGVATLQRVYEMTSDGDITGGSSLAASGLVTLSSAPDGTRTYEVAYTVAKTYTDGGHTHTGPSHTHTGPSHTHAVTVSDPGHTHDP